MTSHRCFGCFISRQRKSKKFVNSLGCREFKQILSAHGGFEDKYDFLRKRKKQHEGRELRDVLGNKNHTMVFELHELKM